MVTERLNFEMSSVSYRCTSAVKKKMITMIMLPTVGLARNDVAQHLAGCISCSNGPILIMFVSNCSSILLNSFQAIKSIYECCPIFRRYGGLNDPS